MAAILLASEARPSAPAIFSIVDLETSRESLSNNNDKDFTDAIALLYPSRLLMAFVTPAFTNENNEASFYLREIKLLC